MPESSTPPRIDADLSDALRTLAEQAVRVGGACAREHFGTRLDVQFKADRSEVSNADREAQRRIVELIRTARPDDALITEEELDFAGLTAPPAPSGDRVCWVIDPIDGTRNYVRRIPVFACSVGVMYAGYPVAGAIGNPMHDLVYSAGQHGGLLINGQPAPARPVVGELLGGTPRAPVVGTPSNPRGPSAAIAHRWLDCLVCRNLGSTSLHLALVASGELDGMLTDNARLWDIAAGWILVSASGGRTSAPDGGDLFPLDVATYTNQKIPTLAGGAGIYDQLIRV